MLECLSVRNCEVEVHLHRHTRQRPCCPLQMINLLKSKLAVALSISENEPIDVVWHALAHGLISWPILESEQVTVELRQSSHISSVENRVKHLREYAHGPRLTTIKVP